MIETILCQMSDELKLWDLQNYIAYIRGSYFFEEEFKMSKEFFAQVPEVYESMFCSGTQNSTRKTKCGNGFFSIYANFYFNCLPYKALCTRNKVGCHKSVRKPKIIDGLIVKVSNK